MQRAQFLIRPHADDCAVWSEPLLAAFTMRQVFLWCLLLENQCFSMCRTSACQNWISLYNATLWSKHWYMLSGKLGCYESHGASKGCDQTAQICSLNICAVWIQPFLTAEVLQQVSNTKRFIWREHVFLIIKVFHSVGHSCCLFYWWDLTQFSALCESETKYQVFYPCRRSFFE